MNPQHAPMEDSNRSDNPSLDQVLTLRRRQLLQAGATVGMVGSLGALLGTIAGCASPAPAARSRMGFAAVAPGVGDRLVVPPGYRAQVIAPWGEPVGMPGPMPAFRPDASNSADEQALQIGMHHDGLAYFALDGASTHGVIALNHEYTDDGLLHPDGLSPLTAEKVRKSQNAHGLSVYEVRFEGRQNGGQNNGQKGDLNAGQWVLVRPSPYARRITAGTPCALRGPAAGHRLLRTAADPAGLTVLGTLNNCAASATPWGTYLSGEENFMFYFGGDPAADAHHRRWGLRERSFFGWESHDPRFDVRRTPHEPNRFGWIVEVDPLDPTSPPVKRTALGRGAHEGAWVTLTRDQRAVVYSGEDARFEYLYKFVSRDRMQPGGARANRELLDHGTLYVARFDADGRGAWLPLVHGQGPLTAANGFADQGEVLVKTRQASDLLGATRMDRPEWLAIDQASRWVYCTLTNNSRRGASGQPGVDAANPREGNSMGHIIRWREDGDHDGTAFSWNHLLLAGDPANDRPAARGNIRGDLFACPDGLAFGPGGLLWIQTDVHAGEMHRGEFARIGNNQMLACDPASGEVRRFLTGPTNCEISGISFTPDGRHLFISVQHPGEPETDRSDPDWPDRHSSWPKHRPGGRPRSANVVIWREDGGVIGL